MVLIQLSGSYDEYTINKSEKLSSLDRVLTSCRDTQLEDYCIDNKIINLNDAWLMIECLLEITRVLRTISYGQDLWIKRGYEPGVVKNSAEYGLMINYCL